MITALMFSFSSKPVSMNLEISHSVLFPIFSLFPMLGNRKTPFQIVTVYGTFSYQDIIRSSFRMFNCVYRIRGRHEVPERLNIFADTITINVQTLKTGIKHKFHLSFLVG